jgi:transposase
VGRTWIDGQRVDQPALLALDPRDLLPEDHLVWRVMAQVEKFDLSLFEAAHRGDGVGRPAYDPKKMLKLLIYCANKRLSSGSQIEEACRDDLGARLIMGGRVVDRSTVDRFRERHAGAIAGLLPQTLAMGERVDLVDLSLVAGDGTKYLANAAMSATVDEQALLCQIGALQAQADALTGAWAEQVSAQAGDLDTTAAMFDLFEQHLPTARDQGARTTADTADTERVSWRKLQAVTRLLHSRRAALAHLRERPSTAASDWAEKVERDRVRVLSCQKHLDTTRARLQAAADVRAQKVAAGMKIPGKGPVPVEEHTHLRQATKALATATARAQTSSTATPPTTTKINTTDPGSRIMPGKHDGFAQRYNVQALACPSQLILAIGIHDSPNDKRALIDLLLAARANLDAAGITRPFGKALFDNGYASEENFTADLPVRQLLVAVEKEARQTQRLRDDTSTAAASWAQMTLTMTEPANAVLYKRRAAIIEPVFAQLFALTGRDLPHRGDTVETDLHLRAVVHNLNKIDKATPRTPPPNPG